MATRTDQRGTTATGEERAPGSLTADLVRGAVGGLVAGGVFLALNAWFADSMGNPADGPLMMMSTVVLGEGAMADGSASVGVGWAVHLVLSVGFGLAFALVANRLRTNGSVALAGTVFGALLYLVNFEVLSPLFFGVFENANQPFEFVAHVVFGTLLSFAFYASGTRRSDPVVSWS